MKRAIGTCLTPSNWFIVAAAVFAVRCDVAGAALCLGLALTLGAGALLTYSIRQRA